jgi:hypothetical protein
MLAPPEHPTNGKARSTSGSRSPGRDPLAHLGFIVSTGLGVFVGSLRRVRGHGGDLRLLNPRPGVEKALQITGLADTLRLGVSRP